MTSATRTIKTYVDIDKGMSWGDGCCTKILDGGGTAYLSVSDELPRTAKDNAQFHAIMHDIWMQAVIEIGDKRTVMSEYTDKGCKAVLVVGFVHEMQMMGEKVPKYMRIETVICPFTLTAVGIRPSTTEFTGKWAKAFCQWLWATGVQSGVKFTEPAHKEYEQYREAK